MTIIAADATNRSVYIRIVEDASGSVPGEPKTGLAFGDITSASFARSQAARVAITPATLASPSAAHSDGGFIEVDATNMPGVYRFDLPDAAIAAGADSVVIFIVPDGSDNALALPFEVELNVAQTVWDALADSHVVDDSFGERIKGLAPAASSITGTPTTTVFETDFPATLDNEIRDQIVVFVDGDNEGAGRRIINSTLNGVNELIVEPAFPQAPAVGDRCVLVSVAQALGISDAVWDEIISSRLDGTDGRAASHLFGTTPGGNQTLVSAGATATVFETGLTEGDDFWNGHYLTFIEGNLAGQTRRITDFADALGKITVSPGFTAAPDISSDFVIQGAHAPSVVEALLDEAIAELAGVPAVPTKVRDILSWLLMKTRNKKITDGNTEFDKIHNDADAEIATAALTDAAGVFTREKYT